MSDSIFPFEVETRSMGIVSVESFMDVIEVQMNEIEYDLENGLVHEFEMECVLENRKALQIVLDSMFEKNAQEMTALIDLESSEEIPKFKNYIEMIDALVKSNKWTWMH